ncbi:uncharacterized protein AMSG_03927 [Thecamonas trahens ATCC 50062]|uniref:Plectin/eS10 N-terminal domain-containing protein n=1 Tax=Thecamonas trahens ATCC 50062 TaxID=461836 RepID=A0A0L0D6J6_THETB|nr:hypothetical protein AMSG_03927 [Thecamonas trahens ATCC 50062]KNC47696.1 hypothetical protein AMSG_03927 [Thecamonas trahens ATCC 50062]|eukprot:XP_013759178.1 hypothetical protein AMSG_03927 [Thecamonas trahens ATCC 50062]
MAATNLEVMNTMKSLKSRGFVRETYAWQYSYYFLTDEGLDYIREFLHLPATIIPATLKKTQQSQVRNAGGRDDRRGGRGDRRSRDRDSFRGEGKDKKTSGFDSKSATFHGARGAGRGAGRGAPRS